jgi:bifunctional non-homologous end joining protein LigD
MAKAGGATRRSRVASAHAHPNTRLRRQCGGHDWTKRFGLIADEMAMLPARELILDGEVISARESVFADFGALQDDLTKGRVERMVYYAFDLIFFDGFDLRDSPLIERKKLLAQFLEEAKPNRILLSEHFENGAMLLKKACALGLEGIVTPGVFHSTLLATPRNL